MTNAYDITVDHAAIYMWKHDGKAMPITAEVIHIKRQWTVNEELKRIDMDYLIEVEIEEFAHDHLYKDPIFKEVQQLTFDTPFSIKDYRLHLSASIGIAFYPEEGLTRNILLENAYSALCYAQQQGRNPKNADYSVLIYFH